MIAPLPKRYRFLAREGAPRMLVEALKLHGTKEARGTVNNPTIIAWASEVRLVDYRSDETPWCGLFMAVVSKRAGYPVVDAPLLARSWRNWQTPSPRPMLGDVLVFWRGRPTGVFGHVGIYVGEDQNYYHVLGGNQNNAVTITRVAKARLLAARRPRWRVGQPSNVRVVLMSAHGPITTDER